MAMAVYSEWSKGSSWCVLWSLMLNVFFRGGAHAGPTVQRFSSNANIFANLMHLDNSVPRKGGVGTEEASAKMLPAA